MRVISTCPTCSCDVSFVRLGGLVLPPATCEAEVEERCPNGHVFTYTYLGGCRKLGEPHPVASLRQVGLYALIETASTLVRQVELTKDCPSLDAWIGKRVVAWWRDEDNEHQRVEFTVLRVEAPFHDPPWRAGEVIGLVEAPKEAS